MPLINYDELIPLNSAFSYNSPIDLINHFKLLDPYMVQYMADLFIILEQKVDIGTSVRPDWNCKLKGTVIASNRRKPPSDLFNMLIELRYLNSKGKVMMSVALEYMKFIAFKLRMTILKRKSYQTFHYSNIPLFNYYWKNIHPETNVGSFGPVSSVCELPPLL